MCAYMCACMCAYVCSYVNLCMCTQLVRTISKKKFLNNYSQMSETNSIMKTAFDAHSRKLEIIKEVRHDFAKKEKHKVGFLHFLV